MNCTFKLKTELYFYQVYKTRARRAGASSGCGDSRAALLPPSPLTCPWPLCADRPHSWVGGGAFVTRTDSSLLPNMQISAVAPPWLVLGWKSTDTSICLWRGGSRWARKRSEQANWCDSVMLKHFMCGENYTTSARVNSFHLFLTKVQNIFILWHFSSLPERLEGLW